MYSVATRTPWGRRGRKPTPWRITLSSSTPSPESRLDIKPRNLSWWFQQYRDLGIHSNYRPGNSLQGLFRLLRIICQLNKKKKKKENQLLPLCQDIIKKLTTWTVHHVSHRITFRSCVRCSCHDFGVVTNNHHLSSGRDDACILNASEYSGHESSAVYNYVCVFWARMEGCSIGNVLNYCSLEDNTIS